MAKVIAVANQKGGVGKTTTTFNVGAGLMEKGNKVLLVDFDPQGNLTFTCGIPAFEDLEHTITNMIDAVIDGKEVSNCIYNYQKRDNGGKVDFIPSNISLANIEVKFLMSMARERVLFKILEPLRKDYDYILIDCPPSLSINMINAMVAAEEVLIPIAPEVYSTLGTEQLIRSINRIKNTLNNDLKIAGILFNIVDRRTNLAKDVISTVKNVWQNDIRIFETEIPSSVKLKESQTMAKSIMEYDEDNKVAIAYKAFINEYFNV